MDLAIKGEDLSWSCRQCSYSLATTAQKPCYWDNKKVCERMLSTNGKMSLCGKIIYGSGETKIDTGRSIL